LLLWAEAESLPYEIRLGRALAADGLMVDVPLVWWCLPKSGRWP